MTLKKALTRISIIASFVIFGLLLPFYGLVAVTFLFSLSLVIYLKNYDLVSIDGRRFIDFSLLVLIMWTIALIGEGSLFRLALR